MAPDPWDWRAYLPALDGLPLLPCGAGAEGKAPLDPATGHGLVGWETAAFSPQAILKLNGKVRSVGTRTGPDARGLLIIDIDGASAIEHCLAHGCDPLSITTWRVIRNTDLNRLKVLFKIPEDLWPQLPGKRKIRTGASPDGQNEQIEVFFGTGQCILIGEHMPTGGHYYWPEGGTPAELIEPPPEWWGLILQLTASGHQEPPQGQGIPLDDQRPPGATWSAVDDLTRAKDAIRVFDAGCSREEWIEIGMAVHAIDDGPAGFDVWDSWSQQCREKYDPRNIRQAWRGFRRGGGITDRTLFGLARKAGWRDPFRQQAPPGAQKAASEGQEPVEAAEDPERLRRYSELLEAALGAAQGGDQDTYAETVAEIMCRFRVGGSAIQSALMRLLTAQHCAGQATPSAGYVDIRDVDPLEPLLPGFIPAREQALLHAPKGTGKTLAALAIARAVTCGTGLLDHSEPAPRGRVLYLATDSGCESMQTQMQELGLLDLPEFTPGHSLQRFFIRGHHARQGVSAWEATIPEILWLLAEVKRQQFDLVIIDSAKACLSLTDIDYTDNRAVGALLTLFQRVLCPHSSVLWLHHDGRENGHNAGAKVWAELPVAVHRIEHVEPPKPKHGGSGEDDQPASSGPLPRRWVCVKSRLGDERQFIYALQPDGQFEVAPDVEVIGNCREAVLAVLSQAISLGEESMGYARLVAKVAEASGRSIKTIKNTLTRMRAGREPDLRCIDRGRYTLSALARARVGGGVCVFGTKSQEKSVIDSDLVGPDKGPDRDQSGPMCQSENRHIGPDSPPSGPTSGPTKTQSTTAESQELVPTHTHPPRARTREESPPTGSGPPTTGSGLPSNAPPWFTALVQLRREHPTRHAASLALALDPDGTGTPTGAQVCQWITAADLAIAQRGPDA